MQNVKGMQIQPVNIPRIFDRYTTTFDLQEASQYPALSEYPEPQDRWHVPLDVWSEMAVTGIIAVPDGPWHVSDHSARRKAAARGIVLDPSPITHEQSIDPARTAAWRKEFLVTDRGLPVHPLAKLGVTTVLGDGTRLGMATGIGRERYYGPQNVGNIALMRSSESGGVEYAVVATIRNGKERISFPGGYAEIGESVVETCLREGNQETGMVEACEAAGIPWQQLLDISPHILWKLRPSITGPCTLNTWLAEHFLMIDASAIPDMQAVQVDAHDPAEIKHASWRTGQQLLADPAFMGAHRRALQAHLEMQKKSSVHG